jgi:hypothetical protein
MTAAVHAMGSSMQCMANDEYLVQVHAVTEHVQIVGAWAYPSSVLGCYLYAAATVCLH